MSWSVQTNMADRQECVHTPTDQSPFLSPGDHKNPKSTFFRVHRITNLNEAAFNLLVFEVIISIKHINIRRVLFATIKTIK